MNSVIVKLVDSTAEFQGALQVRDRVFVQEQQIPVEVERDDADGCALHAIATRDGEALGTGRVVLQEDGFARIGRMAVVRSSRERGIGGRILTLLEDEARARGSRWAMLHAQEYVKSFYVKRGYAEHGNAFMEAGIPHVEMRKRL